jgi:hypothetical protein
MADSPGIFKIMEIPPGGKPGEGEVFQWTASKTPEDAANGGGRAAPEGSFEISSKLRFVRTDYSGAVVPSFQVLGAKREPFTWSGTFDDRFNFDGFSIREYKRAEKVLFRGNIVKISYKDEDFLALVIEFKVNRKLDWQMSYSLTVEVSGRTDNSEMDRTDKGNKIQPGAERDAQTVLLSRLAESHASRPATALVGSPDSAQTAEALIRAGKSPTAGAKAALAQVSADLDKFSQMLDTKTGVLSPIGDFRTMATQMKVIQAGYTRVLTCLVQARSDFDVGYRSAAAVLSFEEWSRTTRTLCRLGAHRAQNAAVGFGERDVAKSKGLYRPFKGESLYNVSRVCYGTPHKARDIQIANNLHSWTLTGDEALTIPMGGTS